MREVTETVRITGITRLDILIAYFEKSVLTVRVDEICQEARITNFRGTIDPGVFEIHLLVNETEGRPVRLRVPYYVTRGDQGGEGHRHSDGY